MSSKNIWTKVIIAIVVVGLAWFFLDHSSGYPKGPDQLLNASSTASAASSTAADTSGIAAASATAAGPSQTTSSTVKNFMHTVTIQTTKGTITFETYDADAPKTVANFISLADKGFYNGLIFHRVIEGFMIQSGDPTGSGSGGPGYQIPDELNPNTPSYQAGYVPGTVAMANTGQPNTGGSQFFIMQGDTPLQHNYTIFGKVISGMDVVNAIAAVSTNGNPPQGANRPLTPVAMTKVTVANNP